jgi:type IV pilus assembly protein PilQ
VNIKPYSGLVAGAVTSFVALSPAYSANMRQVVDLDIRPAGAGLEVQFAIAGDNDEVPQVFTISRDNQTITDILNTTLDLGDRQAFAQQNPMPGIEAIEIIQLDPESVRIIATGQSEAPTGEVLSRDKSSVVFSYTPKSEPSNNESLLIAQVEEAEENTATPTEDIDNTGVEPEILFPDPQIPREGKPSPATTESLLRPSAPIPPFLPRASAPPVGDIAVSTIDTSFPNYVDLGTASVVPRLVLKEAPTQDVLTLLARSAELNLVFADDITDKNISLDLENEPVQDVFNYVLMLSDLDATMRGRTIFVGTELPNAISPKVTRSFRLNQADVVEAQAYLESAGTDENGLLPDIQILTDERLNSITVTGEPKVIEIASNFLTQLDARKRQVAVNVKILDVTLSGNRSISSDIKLLLEDRVGISAGDGIILSPNDLSRTSSIFGEFNPNAITVEQGNDSSISLGEQLDAFDSSTPDDAIFVGNIEQAISVASSIDPSFTPIDIDALGIDPNQIVAVLQDVSTTTSTVNGVTSTIRNVTARLEGLGNRSTSPTRGTNFVGQLVAGLLRNTTSKIIADPTLIIQEDETANIDLTEDIVVGTRQIEITNNDGDVIGAGEEPVIDEVGLQVQVEVTGIDDNGFISMNIEPSISSIAGSEVVDDEPVTLKRESNLTSGLVRLRDDQTLILAGVIDERDIVETSKVPLLGDIPILGSLFRSSSRLNSRRELLFIITPQIVDDSQNATWGYGYVPSETARELLGNENFPTDDN